jgi:hypothetical protein
MKIVKKSITPTYSNMILAGTSSTFRMFPKIKRRAPII